MIRLDQVGGGEADGEEDGKAGAITVRVRDQVGEEMMFKVKKDTKMLKIFEAYSKRRGVSTDSLRFTLDGERIEADSTPKLLELEDNDQIDVLLRQEVCNPITNATYIQYIHSYKGGGADEADSTPCAGPLHQDARNAQDTKAEEAAKADEAQADEASKEGYEADADQAIAAAEDLAR